jgi:hypothetical protein
MARADAPQYTWVCQYCGRNSPDSTLFCTHCGFPAQTSAFELERAKQLGSVEVFLAERQVRQENWRRKPLPKKMLIVAAAPLMVGGAIILQLAWGWRNMALGAAVMGASLLLLWFAR